MRVLVAEDSVTIRGMIAAAVSRLGHEVRVAPDGAVAWRMFQQDPADVVISDWVMPEIEGPELCRLVRGWRRVPYTYFIILTSLDDFDRASLGMHSGADDYLAKPLSAPDLQLRLIAAERVTRLHRALQRQSEGREALLRLARRLATQVTSDHILAEVLHETVPLLQGDDGCIALWDEARQVLTRTAGYCETDASSGPAGTVEQEAAGQRAPVVRTGADSATLAVPLLYEGRLLGTLSVLSRAPHRVFGADDVQLLELVASATANALVGLERAQLLGVTLTARELAHLLYNDLTPSVGLIHLALREVHDERLRTRLERAAQSLDAAVRHVAQLRYIARVETKQTPIGPSLDLERSTLDQVPHPPHSPAA